MRKVVSHVEMLVPQMLLTTRRLSRFLSAFQSRDLNCLTFEIVSGSKAFGFHLFRVRFHSFPGAQVFI